MCAWRQVIGIFIIIIIIIFIIIIIIISISINITIHSVSQSFIHWHSWCTQRLAQ